MHAIVDLRGADKVTAYTITTSNKLVIQVKCEGVCDEIVIHPARLTYAHELARQLRSSLSVHASPFDIAQDLFEALLREDESTPGRPEMVRLADTILDIMVGFLDPAEAFGILGRAGNAKTDQK